MPIDRNSPTGLDIDTLTPYQPRTFVPVDADLTDPQIVTGLYQQLLDRPVSAAAEVDTLIADRSETEAAIVQAQSILYIRMTCQTDDPQRAEAYKRSVETVHPVIKLLGDKLDRKIIEAADEAGLDADRYEVYFRKISSDIELFREENVPLQTEDALLSQQYQTVTGAMTVSFDGTDYPIARMRKFLTGTDRDVRRRAWEATQQRYSEDADSLNEIFDKMISLRDRIARNADFDNYRDYKFREYYRFDYTPADCCRFHEAVETHMVPIQRAIHSLRTEQMGLRTLRPWDLLADPLGYEPLKPFESTPAFIAGMATMFDQLDSQLGEYFKVLVDNGLLDLDSRKGKAPGGYQCTLDEARKPFIFMNAVGADRDLETLMHEGGHAFHALACADDSLIDYRHSSIEFGEVASMSMEFLAASQLSVCFDEGQQKRWWRHQLEMVVRVLVSVAVNDAFQHWVYENPTHTSQLRNDKWVELNKRFGSGQVDWTGFEQTRSLQWHVIMHFFQCPLYYVEYGIAQLGALGLWQQSKESMPAAIANYKKALVLGGSRPLPQLFEAAGLTFDFSEKTIQPLAQTVLSEWEKLTDRQ